MLKIILVFIISYNTHAQLSYGDGSITCNWTVTDTKAGDVFNCDSVNIAGAATISFSSTNYITIRSRGDVVIDGDINISASGTTSGPGGGSSLGGEGGDGTNGGAPDGSGGGGAGGSFGVVGVAGAGGAGTSPGAAGTVGATYYPENNFENNFSGGSPGGAGGTGTDGVFTENGGAGGGGGGGIIIIAKGSITINGNIFADGGDGAAGSAVLGSAGGGGGGDGSGGAIYLIGTTGVAINGNLRAEALANGGGAGGPGGVSVGGAGGNGGDGRIRVDTPTSAYTGAGGVSPAAFQSTLPDIIDPLNSSSSELTSSLESSCSYKITDEKFWDSFIYGLSMGIISLLLVLVFRRLRYYLYSHNLDARQN